MIDSGIQLRIGELARRAGVSPEALRAWERRYGLLRPSRTSGGFRLYSLDDLARIREMTRLLADGQSAAEAAAQVLRRAPDVGSRAAELPPSLLQERRTELHQSILRFDGTGAQMTLDHLLGEFQVELVLREVLLPELKQIGELWSRGEVSIAEEHFASNLIHARLGALAHGWDGGAGSRALLACPPDELHDLPLMMFGIALRRRGWRVTYLGAETPVQSIVDSARAVSPKLVVLASTDAAHLLSIAHGLKALAKTNRVAIAGAGASDELAGSIGAEYLRSDPVTAAAEV